MHDVRKLSQHIINVNVCFRKKVREGSQQCCGQSREMFMPTCRFSKSPPLVIMPSRLRLLRFLVSVHVKKVNLCERDGFIAIRAF